MIGDEINKDWERYVSEQKKAQDEAEDAAWNEYYAKCVAEDEAAYKAERCPCGHSHDQHDYGYGYCEFSHCNCPQFGADPYEYDPPTQVWFTEPPGGHYGYE